MKTIVIASGYVQFCGWCKREGHSANDYQWVGSAIDLHGVRQGAKVIWLTPWLAGGTEAALEKYDQLLEAARCYELDVEYIRT